jgi:amino acid adenylation domain-containing protein
MELETHPDAQDSAFWNSVFSDLPATALFRGNPTKAFSRAMARDKAIRLPLVAALQANTTLLAAWAIVLSRHTGSKDVIFLSFLGEQPSWLAPLRTTLPTGQSVGQWLTAFEEWLTQAAAGPPRNEIVAQAQEESVAQLLTTLIVTSGEATSPDLARIKTPLLINVRKDEGQIEIHYDGALFDEAEVLALGRHLNVVLQGIAANPHVAVETLPILTEEERRCLLNEWNDTATPFPAGLCIHEQFEQQAARTPDAVAVVFCDRQWTYRELNAEANALAHRLKLAGVGPGSFVAICLGRSLELMATLFAVFKAGAAYLPLDPSYPAERLRFMIEDAKPAVIVVSEKTEEVFGSTPARLFRIDDADQETANGTAASGDVSCQSSDAAYILYTSGSTGRPKGVVVTHRNVANFFTAMDGVIGTETGVWLAVTSISFDISVFELFWTLARGFTVILQEEGQWASQTGSRYSLPEQMSRHGVTHLQCTPSLAFMLLSDPASVAALRQLRRLMVGGEPLANDLGHRLAKTIDGQLFNLYGPTETTVWSSAQQVTPNEPQILIGRPVANTQMYILDAARELVPLGSGGELYIGGEGLAREYLHRPDVTEERFITHAFAPDRVERLYRTGDLARHVPDGRLEFMGRIDQQIKIRGVRIELGEIEAVLREQADVHEAVVVVQEDQASDKRLVAYVVPSGAFPSASRLQQSLAFKLPKPLLPSAIVFVTEFPNGKLDRRALSQLEPKKAPTPQESSNDLERQIAATWAEALGVASVGLEERFFDIGGHSLLMIEVHDQLRDKLGHDVPLLDLFRYPTVRSLAKHLGQRSKPAATPASAAAKRGQLRQLSLRKSGPLRLSAAAFLKEPS